MEIEMSKKLSASLEDYLEAIFNVVIKKQAARAKDISSHLDVKNSSVTGALQQLKKKGLVNYKPYDIVTLTDSGSIIARDIVKRHNSLKGFFLNILSIDEDEAEDAACKMEHAIPPKVLSRLILFMDFVENCPRSGDDWLDGFRHSCDVNENKDNCEKCLSNCLKEFKQQKKTKKDVFKESLREVAPGNKCKVVKFNVKSALGKRLADLGLIKGTEIEVIKVAPLGDPIEIKFRGYNLSLRKDEAKNIGIKML